jgi:hypothetical protein
MRHPQGIALCAAMTESIVLRSMGSRRMRRSRAIVVAVALALGSPAAGSGATPAGPNTDAIEQAQRAIAGADADRLFTDKAYAEEMLKHLDVLQDSALHRDSERQGAIESIRLVALLGAGRDQESFALARTLTRRGPGDPQLHQLAVTIGSFSDPDGTLEELEHAERSLANEADRKAFADGIDRQTVAALRRAFSKRKDEDRLARCAQALLRLGWPGDNDIHMADSLRLDVVKADLRRGHINEAQGMADSLVSLHSVLRLIADKRYDVLAEGDRNGRLQRAIARLDIETDRLARTKPDEQRIILQRAIYLRAIGKDKDVLDLLLPKTQDMAVVAASGEDAFWIVNEAAYALLASDRGDEAVQLMKRLLALGIEDHPDLISMAINTSEVMIDAGRFREGAEYSVKLAHESADYASTYGRMWIWAGAACGYLLEGQPHAAAAWLAKLKQGKKDNLAALTRALLCANDLDGAAATLIERLEESAEDALIAVQDYQLTSGLPQGFRVIEARWRQVLQRPAVRAAIDKHGRILQVPMSKSYWVNF